MDQGERLVKNRNPREKASIFSIITFFFTAGIFKKGQKKDLEEHDIYQVLNRFNSEKVGNELESYWNKEYRKLTTNKTYIPLKQNGSDTKPIQSGFGKLVTNNKEDDENKEKRTSILLCLVKCYWKYYLFIGIVQLAMKTGMILLQPLLLSKFVACFEKKGSEITHHQIYKFAFLLIAIKIINCIYNHNYQQMVAEYSLKVRTALCSLIYRKALKLNPAVVFADTFLGKVITLITKDAFAIDGALQFLNDMWISVIQVVLVTYVLYVRIGSSVFSGIGLILLIIPIQVYCGRKFAQTRLQAARKAEERIQLVKQVLSAIKIVKMYTWERYFENLITSARTKEMIKIKTIYYLKAAVLILANLATKLPFFVTILVYTISGNATTAENFAFINQCYFVLRSSVITSIPVGINMVAELCAALKRIQQFLTAEEIEPRNDNTKINLNPHIYMDKVRVEIGNKEILSSVSLDITKGLLIVSGNVGSGKTALIKTILNEYPISGGQLSTSGSVSYAPEEPWLFPSTIRQNILFGQPYDKIRYKEVLKVCALNYDLNKFEKLDNTIVGDKGVNLSKGQQARICLARAVYKNSDIYLLDDCLSALDSQVNKFIFQECIREFLKDKLVILVNNNISNIKHMPSGSVLFIENGKTLDLKQQKEAIDKRITYFIDEDDQLPMYLDFQNDENIKIETDKLLEKNNEATEIKPNNLYHENKKEGKVLWRNYIKYCHYCGGVSVLICTIFIFAICQIVVSYSERIITDWVNIQPRIIKLVQANENDTVKFASIIEKRDELLNIYVLLMLIGIVLTTIRALMSFYFCTRAGRKLHKVLITALLNAKMIFFDSHYIGNIVNRVSKDFHTVDEAIPLNIYENFRSFFFTFGSILLIISTDKYLIIHTIIFFSILYFIQRYYLPVGRSLKRLEAATRSPMVGYVNASLEGLTIVRAADQELILQDEFDRHQDLFTSVFYMNVSCSRMFGFSLDICCTFFIAMIILKFAIWSEGELPGDVHLAVSQAGQLTGLLQWAFRQAAEMENLMTSVERIHEYADAEKEDVDSGALEVKFNWPKMGQMKFNSVSLIYSTTGELALKQIDFEIGSGKKIGIVGRTGAGKSSIISALFRLYDYKGKITIDDMDIKSIPLTLLRSKIGIIPQDPVLFSGTIRSNIDPLQKYTDQEIWNAINKVELKSIITCLDEEVTDNSQRFSAGQKQLLCLARVLISKNKIVVLDEATANIDMDTDRILQQTIQENFSDCTLITIAHRLNTFKKADLILVLENGLIVEAGKPDVLLLDKNGKFSAMLKDAGSDSLF